MISAGVVEIWERVLPLPTGDFLHAHCETVVDMSGETPIFEVRFSYRGEALSVIRHMTRESAISQTDKLKQFLDQRGWKAPSKPAQHHHAC